MNSASLAKRTKALHIAWAMFVSLFFLLYLPDILSSGNLLLPVLEFAPNESPFGIGLAVAFCIAPFFTLLALKKFSHPLFIISVTMNAVAAIYGANEFIREFDLNNSMFLLAIAVPLLTIFAASFAIASLTVLRKIHYQQK